MENRELNRDEIVKALEYCFGDKPCNKCEWHEVGNGCMSKLEQSALSLINELTEENERLQDETDNGVEVCHDCHTKYADKIEQAKADTVRKMQKRLRAEVIEEFATRLKTYYNHLNGGTYASLVSYHVDQVKNIMLGEVTTNGD